MGVGSPSALQLSVAGSFRATNTSSGCSTMRGFFDDIERVPGQSYAKHHYTVGNRAFPGCCCYTLPTNGSCRVQVPYGTQGFFLIQIPVKGSSAKWRFHMEP